MILNLNLKCYHLLYPYLLHSVHQGKSLYTKSDCYTFAPLNHTQKSAFYTNSETENVSLHNFFMEGMNVLASLWIHLSLELKMHGGSWRGTQATTFKLVIIFHHCP